MLDAFLVSPNTVVTAKGDSALLDLSLAENRVFLATLAITAVVEQESLEVSLFTSADGATWETKPVVSLPQKFYVGEYPFLVDLTATPGAKFVRAHWEVARWGRGPTEPRFEFGFRLREVPSQELMEAKAEAALRR